MAHILELTDGVTTVNFLDECGASGWCHIKDGGLTIDFPSKKQVWTGSNIWRQGRELASHAYENRKITLAFEIGGDDWDDILDARGTIDRLMFGARENQTSGLMPKVLLKFQLDTTTSYVYFDVLDGDLVVPPDLMSVEKLNWTKCSPTDKVLKGCVLTLTCRPFARGVETQIVTNENIENSDDGANDNYVTWAAAAIDGDVPGPIRIQFKNTHNVAPDKKTFYLGVRDVGTPGDWVGVYEAEDADTHYYAPAQQGPTAALSGDYSERWTLTTTSEVTISRWNIAAEATPVDLMGKVRAIAVGAFPETAKYRVKASYESITLREYPQKRVDAASSFIDLGVIDMQPWPINLDQGSGLWHFDITVQPDTSSSTVIDIDAIYVIPAEDYKYRKWEFMGYNLPYNDSITDVGRTDQVALGTTGEMYFIINWKGLPIHINANSAGKLCFLWFEDDGDYDAEAYTAQINVWHTPYYVDVRGAA